MNNVIALTNMFSGMLGWLFEIPYDGDMLFPPDRSLETPQKRLDRKRGELAAASKEVERLKKEIEELEKG